MKITIDTSSDSKEHIRHAIGLLNNLIDEETKQESNSQEMFPIFETTQAPKQQSQDPEYLAQEQKAQLILQQLKERKMAEQEEDSDRVQLY